MAAGAGGRPFLVQSKVFDFGFEMQESSDFEIPDFLIPDFRFPIAQKEKGVVLLEPPLQQSDSRTNLSSR